MLRIRVYRTLIALGIALAIFWLTFLYANANNFWLDFPKGYDIYAHLTTMRYYMTHWPHIDWNYQWATGMPRIYTYPPLPYMATILVVRLSSLPLEMSAQILLFATYFLSALATYALVTKITRRRTAGFLSAFMLLASGVVWSWATILGLYPRVVSTPLIPLVAWSTVTYLHSQSRRASIGTSLLLAMALCSHFLIGLVASITALALLLFGGRGIRERITHMARILLVAGFLSAFVYIPLFLLAAPESRFLRLRYLQQLPLVELLGKFIWPSSTGSLFPGFALVLIVLVMLTTRDVLSDRAIRRYFFAFVTLSMLWLVYLFGIYMGVPPEVYINGVPHWEGMYFLAYSASVALGIMLGKVGLYQPSRKRHIVSIAVVASLMCLGFAQLNPSILYPSYREVFSNRHQAESVVRAMLPKRAELSHRFGTEQAGIALWFNYEYPMPQVHDYFAQGVLIPDWRYWLDVAVWEYEGNDEERQYLMDWFSIKWFVVGPPHSNYQKFSARPDLYYAASADGIFSGFEFLAPTPILSTSNRPSALVIARRHNYNNFFQALSHSNFNSQHIIPLRGHKYIDNYTLDELCQFDALILYRYSFHDQAKAFDLLAEYVRNGGGLIVEAKGSPFDNASSIPEPIPVSQTTATDYGTTWNFKSAESKITTGVDFSAFGPAIYEEGPWGVSSTLEEGIREWAKAVLWTNGHPIVAMGEYGQGRVVWTGMNLPYHINSYKNEEESRFLARMIEWASGGKEISQPDHTAEFVHPQKRIVTVRSPAKGVLFKECYFPNWHAYLVTGDSRTEVKIYRAGPDFMYVPIPKDAGYPLQVIFEYKKSLLEWVSIGISVATFLGLIVYALEGWLFPPILSRLGRSLLRLLKAPFEAMRKWWTKEE